MVISSVFPDNNNNSHDDGVDDDNNTNYERNMNNNRCRASSLTHSSGVLLGLPTLLHFFLSLGMVIASLQLMFACVARSFSQVVLGLPLGLVPCRRPIIRSSVMPPFLVRWSWKANRLLRSSSRRVGFVLVLLNTSSWVTCSVHEMRSILR